MKNTFRKIEASFRGLHYKFYNWNQEERTKNKIKRGRKPENQKDTKKEEVEIVRMKNTPKKALDKLWLITLRILQLKSRRKNKKQEQTGSKTQDPNKRYI